MALLWKDTGKTIRFFGIDGRSAGSIVLLLMHFSWWTLGLTVAIIVIFTGLERFDYTLPNAARKLRSMLAGRRRKTALTFRQKKYRSE